MGWPAFLQGIFPTQGSNPHILTLPHRRRILYSWATGEAPFGPYIAWNTDTMSYPKHHCSQFAALIGSPPSSIAFSCNYNKIQSCFFVFLGPGEMGLYLLTHSSLQYQGRLLFAPQIPWHYGLHSVPIAKFLRTTGLLHSHFLCLNSPGHFSDYWLLLIPQMDLSWPLFF